MYYVRPIYTIHMNGMDVDAFSDCNLTKVTPAEERKKSQQQYYKMGTKVQGTNNYKFMTHQWWHHIVNLINRVPQ